MTSFVRYKQCAIDDLVRTITVAFKALGSAAHNPNTPQPWIEGITIWTRSYRASGSVTSTAPKIPILS